MLNQLALKIVRNQEPHAKSWPSTYSRKGILRAVRSRKPWHNLLNVTIILSVWNTFKFFLRRKFLTFTFLQPPLFNFKQLTLQKTILYANNITIFIKANQNHYTNVTKVEATGDNKLNFFIRHTWKNRSYKKKIKLALEKFSRL